MNNRGLVEPLTKRSLELLTVIAVVICLSIPASAQTDEQKAAFTALDPLFVSFKRENQIPGLVYGVVVDGKLVHVHAFGVQDTKTKTPVTPESVFRIASMSKNFTALAVLKLRDEGKLSLDSPAERYIPEVARFRYPTSDSPKITVRDLLTHSAGLVNDDPWGDRQLNTTEADFSSLLAAGILFSRAPGAAYEYSNLGYALLGRLVTNVSGRSYANYINDTFLKPLRMTSTGYDFGRSPADRRAKGYRWEGGEWIEEPVLGPGVFGAMGGLVTTANDYARYMAWVLAAWPPRDGKEDGILKRASVRELSRAQTFATAIPQPEPIGCPRVVSYSMGIIPSSDCVLGMYLNHSGGLPGYGSNILLLPERGVGIFAFANLTYAPAAATVRAAAAQLVRSGAFPLRSTPVVSQQLQAMAVLVQRIYAAGDVLAAREALAMNVLLDRGVVQRNAQIASLKQTLGTCSAAAPIRSDSAMSANITFPCERGTLRVRVVLAPTTPPALQTLEFMQ